MKPVLKRLVSAEKLVTDPPNNDKDYTWQTQMERDYHGKMRKPGQVLPEGTFSKSPSEIANLLKQHSTGYDQAQKKLNSYINRSGRDLQGEDKNRLYDAKETLKNAYGVQDKPTTTTSGADYPMYVTPSGHAGDKPTLFTGLDEDVLEEDMRGGHPTSEFHFSDKELAKVKTRAVARLQASILNSVQDPSTRISSVETDAVLGPSTNDSSDDAFHEMKTPSASDVVSRLITADKWVKNVHPNHNAVPEGTFEKSAEDIAKMLKRVSKDHAQASERLNFYRNRGGKNVDQSKMKQASDLLKKMYD